MASMENGANNIVQDRLSCMPDEVIVHILSCMATIDAVRTMLLRRFGDLWTLVHTLRLDFDGFVRNVLMLHKRSTIDTFHLYICEFDDYFNDPNMIDDVQMWLRFAVYRGVKDLYFAFNGPDDLALPCCVFTCQSIETLRLSGCMIDEYEDGQPLHMGSLRNLSLICVHGYNDAFNELISGCPSLQELTIDNPQGLQVLIITTPSISN
ncbi:hypothetical protein RND81_09G126000 [Saponaria officinalis]|uniref:F-box/LRR-repeat protein 15/At3g58940/PEG3-like LRR domain-containing protein n=1 Tax=Saponaria officinalis TaxID=3572 RepID=A0AAW1IM46_SAPOF